MVMEAIGNRTVPTRNVEPCRPWNFPVQRIFDAMGQRMDGVVPSVIVVSNEQQSMFASLNTLSDGTKEIAFLASNKDVENNDLWDGAVMHSVGGWITRQYLFRLTGKYQRQVKSFMNRGGVNFNTRDTICIERSTDEYANLLDQVFKLVVSGNVNQSLTAAAQAELARKTSVTPVSA
jgi:hypothetical protein